MPFGHQIGTIVRTDVFSRVSSAATCSAARCCRLGWFLPIRVFFWTLEVPGLDGRGCAAEQQHDDAHDSARVGHRRRPLSLAREFPVSTQRASCFVNPAQPLKRCVAIILPDAKHKSEGVKDTYPRRDLVGLADARDIGVRQLC